jgi:hypothetical protein
LVWIWIFKLIFKKFKNWEVLKIILVWLQFEFGFKVFESWNLKLKSLFEKLKKQFWSPSLFSAQKSWAARLIFLGNFHAGPSLSGILAQPVHQASHPRPSVAWAVTTFLVCRRVVHRHLPPSLTREQVKRSAGPPFSNPQSKWCLTDSLPLLFHFEIEVF